MAGEDFDAAMVIRDQLLELRTANGLLPSAAVSAAPAGSGAQDTEGAQEDAHRFAQETPRTAKKATTAVAGRPTEKTRAKTPRSSARTWARSRRCTQGCEANFTHSEWKSFVDDDTGEEVKTITCDVCRQTIGFGQYFWGCPSCDWDLCEGCADQPTECEGCADQPTASQEEFEFISPSPMPLPALNISPALREHVKKMVKRRPRQKQGRNRRKDFVLDKDFTWSQVKHQVHHSYLSPLPPCPCLCSKTIPSLFQVRAIPEVVSYVEERIGSEACIVDAVVTTTLPSETPPGPQKLHRDIRLEDGAAAGTLIKLVFSIQGRALMTEFGMPSSPMQAPTCLFDAVRCPVELIVLPCTRTQTHV